jgi:mannose-6-phosphate isomerase-like protein (cupin superfamily)
MVRKIKQIDAFKHDTEALKGWYYQLPELDGGRTVVYAEVTGDHGQRVIGKNPRIYFAIDGEGEFVINNEITIVTRGDVVVVPPFATYSYRATKLVFKLLLFMDLLDLGKLPPKK